MDNYNYNYNYQPAPAAPQSTKAAFTPASIFFIIAGFFGFIANAVAVDFFDGFPALGILASLGLIAIGVFIIIRKLDIGVLAAVGGTATFVLIAFFTTFENSLASTLSVLDDDIEGIAALAILAGLLYTAAFALFAIFALAKFLPAGNPLIGMKKVWFVPLICGIVGAVFEFIYCCILLAAFEEVGSWLIPDEVNAKYILEIIASIFLAVAIALGAKWFRGVLEAKALEVPAQPVYQAPVQPTYQQPVQPVYQQPAQPVYQQPAQPVYQQPVAPVQPAYQAPVQPTYQQPVAPVQPAAPVVPSISDDVAAELMKYKDLCDKGIITQAEYDAKKAQLLNL